jgi:hypothetical protein
MIDPSFFVIPAPVAGTLLARCADRIDCILAFTLAGEWFAGTSPAMTKPVGLSDP